MVYDISEQHIYDKWKSFKEHVRGLAFSYGAGTVSIDEKLGETILVSGKGIYNRISRALIEAEELLEMLDNDVQTFKNLIDYLLNPDSEHQRMGVVNNCNNLSDLIIECVIWNRTEEGEHFWNAVYSKLRNKGY